MPTPRGSHSARGGLLEHQDVLLRKEAGGLHPYESGGAQLPDRLCLGHLVQLLDRDEGVFAPVLDEHDPPARPQASHDPLHHLAGVGELRLGIMGAWRPLRHPIST